MSHPLPYEVNCSILFTELPLLERPDAARRAGFEGVEFWWPFAEAVPADKDIEAFVAAVQNAGAARGTELLRRRHARRRPRSRVVAGARRGVPRQH